MQNRAIRWVIITGSLALISILAFQLYWFSENWKVRDRAIDQSIQIALRKTAKVLADYNQSELPTENLILRRSTNYYVVNVDDRIDANLLEYYMRRSLNEVGLDIDFEYAIYDCEEDQMVYGDYCSAEEVPAAEPTVDLPRYDRFTYYFGVYFPELRGLILSGMNLSLVLSGLLLLTMLFFAYAIYVIQSQRRLTRLQKEFINNMTHEFKTPLSSIAIGAETFLSNEKVKADNRLYRYAGIIRSQTNRLNQQVEKILDLARLEKEHFSLKKKETDLHEIIVQAVDDLKDKFRSEGGELICEPEATHARIMADPLHVNNVVYNLLDNAFKYSDSNPTAVIRTEDRGSKLLLSVRDRGVGIDKSEIKRIFRKFYRVPTGNVHNTKGFGLGLYYVKQIARLHRWKIEVESRPGEGTEFRIYISTV